MSEHLIAGLDVTQAVIAASSVPIVAPVGTAVLAIIKKIVEHAKVRSVGLISSEFSNLFPAPRI
jgi:hypothetical protein